MKKRFLSLGLALTLLLTACGGAADPTGPSSPVSSQESAPSPDETEQNKRKIESMIWRYKNPPDDIPACVDDKPNGSALFYDDGTLIHIPIPSQSPGIAQRYARSLRDDVVMIVYRPEDKTDTLSAVTTEDKIGRAHV